MTKLATSIVLFLGLFSSCLAVAQQTTDSTAPSYDLKAQALLDLERVQKKFVDLANAVPSEKFGWRPSEDTRSFGEVLLHVSGERYQILALMGATPPSDFNGKTYEKSTSDKAKIIAELEKTWEFAKQTITGMSNADFAKLLPKLGPQANAGTSCTYWSLMLTSTWDRRSRMLGRTAWFRPGP